MFLNSSMYNIWLLSVAVWNCRSHGFSLEPSVIILFLEWITIQEGAISQTLEKLENYLYFWYILEWSPQLVYPVSNVIFCCEPQLGKINIFPLVHMWFQETNHFVGDSSVLNCRFVFCCEQILSCIRGMCNGHWCFPNGWRWYGFYWWKRSKLVRWAESSSSSCQVHHFNVFPNVISIVKELYEVLLWACWYSYFIFGYEQGCLSWLWYIHARWCP